MSRAQVQLWYKRFEEGREDVNHDARPGGLSTSIIDENIEAVKKMILDNRWITIIVDDVGICWPHMVPVFIDSSVRFVML